MLQPLHVAVPNAQKWESLAFEFWRYWDFPNAIGSIDGKHVQIRAPFNSNSEYRNYKGFFSIVLMVVADARYGITLMDVGESGANSDGAIFGRSVIGQTLEEDRLSIPKAKKIPGVLTASVQVEEERPTLLLVIVGDEAFPLKPYLMRVFPSSKLNRERRIFNYRLCRARRIVENVFGILAVRRRCFCG